MSAVKLTIYFEDPFWVGVFERIEGEKLSVCKETFGAEPKDQEVWAFILQRYAALRFSPAVQTEQRQTADNPKRRLRNAQKQLQSSGIGTKSQRALAAQHEQQKTERRQFSRAQKEAEKQRRFDLKQQKKKEKHLGH